jgi:YihY family inner membrane protein
MGKRQRVRGVPRQLFSFLTAAMRDFRRNQGLLLSGAVAYYTLLSIVPLSILALIGLSRYIEEGQLLHTLSTYLEMIIPGYAATLTDQARVFLKHRDVISVVGLVVMLFFSSLAFTVLENAMSVIFFHRVKIKRRHFLVSAVIPYVYILVLGLGVLIVSFITGAIETVEQRELVLFGLRFSLEGISGAILYLLGIVGEVLLLTSLYMVMPVGRITFRRALIGGIVASILWEITRRVLVWYYSVISVVNLIYGSFATAVVALLSAEAVALILLLGAQVIAELERATKDVAGHGVSGFKT